MTIKKTILFLLFFLIYQLQSNAQAKLVFKPGMSFSAGFNHLKDWQYVDPSFITPEPALFVSLNGRMEFHFDSLDMVDLTVKGSEAACSYSFGLPLFSFIDQISIRTTQLNFAYNMNFRRAWRILKKRKNGELHLRPKIGLGAGLTINASEKYYQKYHHDRFISNIDINQGLFYSRVYTAEHDANIGCNILLRAGISLLKNRKELCDLILEYNIGLSNLADIDVQYNINNELYSALLGSRGTNINATIGVPITLIRFK